MNSIACIAKLSDAEVSSVGRHQTHAVERAGCGEMAHCGPLVLVRVVHEHLVIVAITATITT